MSSNNNFGITFDLPKNQSNVIKVIGVGGGGSNAINHMFKQGIKGVDFVICLIYKNSYTFPNNYLTLLANLKEKTW